MNKNIRILICDDDPIVHQSLSLYLDNEDFLHDSAFDGRQALEMVKKERYDLMLLDQMMPGVTGMEVCQTVRRESTLPIIMLTARGEEIDRILGLEMGADDYIVKPFSGEEVMARIRAILRRMDRAPGQRDVNAPLVYDNLCIHMADARVTIDGHVIPLTKKELEILYTLAENCGKLFSREMLLSLLWGYDYYGDSRTVDSHVKRLRVKLDAHPHPRWQIKTIWGMGYKFEVEEDEQ